MLSPEDGGISRSNRNIATIPSVYHHWDTWLYHISLSVRLLESPARIRCITDAFGSSRSIKDIQRWGSCWTRSREQMRCQALAWPPTTLAVPCVRLACMGVRPAAARQPRPRASGSKLKRRPHQSAAASIGHLRQ